MARTTAKHNFGPCCRLAPIAQATTDEDEPPRIASQFFYASTIPIDDPFPSSSLAGASESKGGKPLFRPFSQGDNNDLERGWRRLASESHQRAHGKARRNRSPSPDNWKEAAERLKGLERYIAWAHFEKHGVPPALQEAAFAPGQALGVPVADGGASSIPVCCSELYTDVQAELRGTFCALSRKRLARLSADNVVQDVMMEFRRRHMSKPNSRSGAAALAAPGVGNASTAFADAGISGNPFVRVGSPDMAQVPLPSRPTRDVIGEATGGAGDQENPRSQEADEVAPMGVAVGRSNESKNGYGQDGDTSWRVSAAEVAVGVSRLHMVSLPGLLMKPIYWSPVNDVSVVMRGTWFYRDTMMPVPPAVANQLEAGYKELRPWTETWSDELRCAVEVGPLGEEKVSHRLWPEELPKSADETRQAGEVARIPRDPYCAARCCRGEAAAEGTLQDRTRGGVGPKAARSFSNYHVIYHDSKLAYLLKPSLKPSAYYGRRPVSKILKGMTVGVPVIRGFDSSAWERLHDKKNARHGSGTSSRLRGRHGETGETGQRPDGSPDGCEACMDAREQAQVTDLVLVIHGIGQKFAERVESFHFTHAINSFRRSVNLELGDPVVGQVLRDGQNGIMVLPVNWRHNLSFEDGGPMTEADKENFEPEGFGLKDIEPPTIPAVRGMISDIMFDIPFYMSQHKPMMIQALVHEANRVYGLWCRNNPGFDVAGRVHLIGHSLGSAMAVDILSRQPNSVPRPLSRPAREAGPGQHHFDFDTVNLFLLGSPAAFFLLLERGLLLPRRGRVKPGAEAADMVAGRVVGEAGRYGCIAVDNVYNILAKEDPIAYLLNGAIDAGYAASLKTAYVPSTSTSFLQSMGSAMRNLLPGTSQDQPLGPSAMTQPKATMERLPSQLELEVHDFTREEIAERKAYLLNDNGQLDYYLHSAGAPLEIQYLNMFSAHSCYWTHRDFIRLLCIEVGRAPGRANTLPAMRAVKSKKSRLHDLVTNAA